MFRYIRSMSLDKRSIELKLLSIVDQLTDHLIKLYLFPSSEYVDHWHQEVWSFLNKVSKLKGSNKYPSYKWIFSIISGYTDMVDVLVNQVKSDYKSLDVEREDVKELESILIDYMDWISSELSQKGVVSRDEVYLKLEELGL